MSPTRYLIIGASAAGMSAAQAIRELDCSGSITVLSAENVPPYFRPLIPSLIGNRKIADDVTLLGREPHPDASIDLRLNAVATAVIPADHTVIVNGVVPLPYDRLLIATGSRPLIPPSIDGTDTAGVFALRTLADARLIAVRTKDCRQAVLAGGGMLNVKTALALLKAGLRVTMVVTSPEVLSRVMDPPGAALVHRTLLSSGLSILARRSVTRVLGRKPRQPGTWRRGGPGPQSGHGPRRPAGGDGVTGVLLDSGEEIPCEMVCLGKGVVPNVEFLRDSGVELRGGIVVDACTHSSAPDVYAAGEVAVTFDPITGTPMTTALWTNAVEMGQCAGRNMAGRPTVFTGTFGMLNATQATELPFVSMGVVRTDEGSGHTSGAYQVREFRTAESYRKLIFLNVNGSDRLIGAVVVGDISRAGLYRQLIRERTPIAQIRKWAAGNGLP